MAVRKAQSGRAREVPEPGRRKPKSLPRTRKRSPGSLRDTARENDYRDGADDDQGTPEDDAEGTTEISLPWKVRSRSQQGFRTEQEIAKKRGARLHPRSGAGAIKWDASDEDTVIEVKDAAKTHTIQGAMLSKLFRQATQQGKQAEYIVYFADYDITLVGKLKRGKG